LAPTDRLDVAFESPADGGVVLRVVDAHVKREPDAGGQAGTDVKIFKNIFSPKIGQKGIF
jgi:hypothetical protein